MTFDSQTRNLLKCTGIIGRAEFIVNCMYITILGTVLTLPLIFTSIFNGSALSGDVGNMFTSSAFVPLLLYLIALPLSFYMNFANFVKRFADITGEANTLFTYILFFCAFIALHLAIAYEALKLGSYFMCYAQLALLILFASIKGKITGKNYNKDMAKFNWGAFWGTWIWGLMNKVPAKKTLWAIPAFITGTLPYFAVICGIKGNKWAYDARDWQDMEDFHESQSRQGLIWSLLAPTFWIILIITIFLLFLGLFMSYAKTPEGSANLQILKEKAELSIKDQMRSAISTVFTDYKYEDGIYKFYMNPKDWSRSTKDSKIRLFTLAADYCRIMNAVESEEKNYDASQMVYLAKTKIYSSFNNEILAEYVYDKEDVKNIFQDPENIKKPANLLKAVKSFYKLNEHPTVP